LPFNVNRSSIVALQHLVLLHFITVPVRNQVPLRQKVTVPTVPVPQHCEKPRILSNCDRMTIFCILLFTLTVYPNFKAFQVNTDPDPIRIQGFDDQKLKKKIQLKIFLLLFFDNKLQFDFVRATGEAFTPQKRTSSTSKNKIY
jgi:hypothetical protein